MTQYQLHRLFSVELKGEDYVLEIGKDWGKKQS